MIVIRIEHEDGHGLFRPKDARPTCSTLPGCERIWSRHTVYNKNGGFPMPQDDGIENATRAHFYAYKSIDLLYTWYRKTELRRLISHGYKIIAMDVWPVIEGKHQVAYLKEHVTQTIDLSKLIS